MGGNLVGITTTRFTLDGGHNGSTYPQDKRLLPALQFPQGYEKGRQAQEPEITLAPEEKRAGDSSPIAPDR